MPDGTEILLRALRRTPGDEQPKPEDLSDAGWASMLAVTPLDLRPYLAFWLAQISARGRVPAAVRESLETSRRAGAVSHLQRQALLRRMTLALDRDGVPFVVLKGMVLAHLAYPEPALRPMVDIDLWTRPEHVDAAARTLVAAGLRYPVRLTNRKPAADRPDAEPTRIFELPDSGVVVELHGRLQSMAIACPGWEEGAWARCVRADLGGVHVLVPEAGDMLTHLAIHCSAYHRFEVGLRALLDIALWVECAAEQLAWRSLRERWTRDGCETWIYLTLALAHELLEARVPAEYFRDSVPPPHLAELRTIGRTQLLDATRTMPPALAKLSTLPSFGSRVRWIGNRLTTWYWAGGEDVRRTPIESMRQAARRIMHDLRYKIPPYIRGLVSGSLRGDELRRRTALAVGRDRLAELVVMDQPSRQKR